jgi:hypothetical protein
VQVLNFILFFIRPNNYVMIRFAQRVSLIKNKASINENADPDAVIRRLKSEILTLREEISFLKVNLQMCDVFVE